MHPLLLRSICYPICVHITIFDQSTRPFGHEKKKCDAMNGIKLTAHNNKNGKLFQSRLVENRFISRQNIYTYFVISNFQPYCIKCVATNDGYNIPIFALIIILLYFNT